MSGTTGGVPLASLLGQQPQQQQTPQRPLFSDAPVGQPAAMMAHPQQMSGLGGAMAGPSPMAGGQSPMGQVPLGSIMQMAQHQQQNQGQPIQSGPQPQPSADAFMNAPSTTQNPSMMNQAKQWFSGLFSPSSGG